MTDDHARHYRKDWMSDDQWECAKFVADLFFGFHHVRGEFKPCGRGLEVNARNSNWAATFDYNGLTRAVVMAHDRMIRFEIRSSGPGLVKLCLWQRHTREGRMYERHPTLEEAVTAIRAGQRY